MSTKTIKQRIAIVAVSALTAGFLSVAVAPSANADAAVHNTIEQNTLVLATTADGDGSAATSLTTTAGQSFSQIGWIADTRTSSLTTTGGVYVNGSGIATGTVLAGSKIAFMARGSSATPTDGLTVAVTGGTIGSLVATSTTAPTLGSTTAASYAALNGSSTVAVVDYGTATTNTDDANGLAGIFSVSGAAGSIATITVYSGAGIESLGTATAGTFMGQWQLTIAAANTSGVYNAAESKVFQQACLANATTGTSGTSAFDTTSSCANGRVGVVYVQIRDVYTSPITTGTVTASASVGQIIGSGTTTTGSIINGATTGFSTIANDADGTMWFYVKQPVANTAGSTTVSITLDGATIGTKTIKWLGDVATLAIDEVNSCAVFSTNTATDTTEANTGAGCVVYVAKDAAGNNVTLTAQPSVADATGALVGSTLSTTTATAGYGVVQSSSVGYGISTLLVPNNSLSGAATYQLQLTNAAGATIKSAYAKATVSRGSAASFTASWDKAVYQPGDIATLTIAAKDLYGNPMANGVALTGADIIANGMTVVGSACSATSKYKAGAKTCTYAASVVSGGYGWSVGLTTLSAQSAVTGSVKIASTDTVSNAEVLKSIVALIASINKQIQALQKLILKR
jgi:hypothetical protein